MTGDNLQPTDDQAEIRCLKARWIVPVSRPPIHGGWLRIVGDQVAGLGEGKPPSSADDLGDVAILPRLINAHTHLEFSDCDVPIGQPGTLLSDWIGQVVATRADTTAQQKTDAIARGIQQSRDAGVALIAEIATPPCEYPTLGDSPQILSFAEVLGLSHQRSDERIAAAAQHIQTHPRSGISPHAPYSTSRDAIQACIDLAIRHQRTVAMHVAESPAERELLEAGSGKFASALKDLGVWQAGLFPWSGNAIADLLGQLASASRAPIIHGNDLTNNEISRLAMHSQATVVYCPRTHAFFRYGRHPVDRLLAAGVRVALGTDSKASNPDLDVWSEVQYLLRHRSDIDPHSVIAMATIHGADALGRADLGRIKAGSNAKLGVVPSEANSVEDLYADFSRHDFRPLE